MSDYLPCLRPLDRAITIWQAGHQIDLVLATQLMLDGHDVDALETKYFI